MLPDGEVERLPQEFIFELLNHFPCLIPVEEAEYKQRFEELGLEADDVPPYSSRPKNLCYRCTYFSVVSAIRNRHFIIFVIRSIICLIENYCNSVFQINRF